VVFVGAVASELEGVMLVVSRCMVEWLGGMGCTLKLGSLSHEMRLAPQRHFASVYTIVAFVRQARGMSDGSS
jgi:hypothetical protein